MANIVFTGGGTAGHYAPNYALIPLIKNDFDGVFYIGSKFGPEKEAAENFGVKYYGVTCAKLNRSLDFKNALIPFKLLKGIAEAKKTLKKISPKVVFSKGGYVSLPVVIAAKGLKIPVISHESDISAGLANKISAKFSSLVLTSFERTVSEFKNAKCVGTPIRESLFKPYDKEKIMKNLGFKGEKKILLVTGGSQGSAAINEAVREGLCDLLKTYDIVHLCGKGKLSGESAEGYKEIEFSQDIGELYAVADTALSRAGANTLFELVALKIPTLAVPLPKGNSRGDQVENAEYFKNNGLIEVLKEENLSKTSLLKSLRELELKREKIKADCERKDYRKSAEKIAMYIKSFK